MHIKCHIQSTLGHRLTRKCNTIHKCHIHDFSDKLSQKNNLNLTDEDLVKITNKNNNTAGV